VIAKVARNHVYKTIIYLKTIVYHINHIIKV